MPALPVPRRGRPGAAAVRAARLAGRRPTPVAAGPDVPGVGRLALRRRCRLTGDVRLADALNHLYVLLPVLDDAKHYWVSADEVDKLVRAGDGWLAGHPEQELITRRYLAHQRELTARRAGPARRGRRRRRRRSSTTRVEGARTWPSPIGRCRWPSSAAAPCSPPCGPPARRRVRDLGCGEGALVGDLLADPAFTEVVGVDVSARALRDRRAQAAARPDAGPPARPAQLLPVLADLPRRPAGRPRRRRADGGDRARRPAAAGGARARPSSAHAAPGTVDRHHAERRVQRALRDPAGRARCGTATTASSGPAREFRAWADAGRRRATATRCGSCRSAPTTPRSARRPRWRSSRRPTDGGGRMTHDRARRARAVPGRAGRRQRLGQVHLRAARTSGRPR